MATIKIKLIFSQCLKKNHVMSKKIKHPPKFIKVDIKAVVELSFFRANQRLFIAGVIPLTLVNVKWSGGKQAALGF